MTTASIESAMFTSFSPVAAMPWMKARCRKKNSRIIGSVPSTAIAISWSQDVP